MGEAVSGGSYEFNLKAGATPLVGHRGDFCKADPITLPGGIGTINWKGFPGLLPAGPVELDMSIQMSAAIQASLACTTIKLTG